MYLESKTKGNHIYKCGREMHHLRILSLAAGGREESIIDMLVNSLLLGVQALCRVEIRKNGLEYYCRAN